MHVQYGYLCALHLNEAVKIAAVCGGHGLQVEYPVVKSEPEPGEHRHYIFHFRLENKNGNWHQKEDCRKQSSKLNTCLATRQTVLIPYSLMQKNMNCYSARATNP
jgi:hypothetical protein